ncbi:MAG: hypothetical protein K0S24_4720 [Sphingobacterium sp.]|jgi:hypothetical protein|nr:hypothetical protein [Sphingobacterium sp.]
MKLAGFLRFEEKGKYTIDDGKSLLAEAIREGTLNEH